MILKNDYVKIQTDYMEKNLLDGIAIGKHSTKYSKNLVPFLERMLKILNEQIDIRNTLPGTGGAIFRMKAIKQVGGFDNKITGAGEDIEMAYRIRAAGWYIGKTHAIFFERFKTNWKALWNEKFWKGQGMYEIHKRHSDFDNIFELFPPVGIISGLLLLPLAFQLTGEKRSLLLPFYNFFVKTGLFFGYIKGFLLEKR